MSKLYEHKEKSHRKSERQADRKATLELTFAAGVVIFILWLVFR